MGFFSEVSEVDLLVATFSEICALLYDFAKHISIWGMWSYGIKAVPQSALVSGTHSRYLHHPLVDYFFMKTNHFFSR